MPVRVLDLSGTALSQGSVVGSAQLYGLRQAAQRAGGSLQALLMARCSLIPSAPDKLIAWHVALEVLHRSEVGPARVGRQLQHRACGGHAVDTEASLDL